MALKDVKSRIGSVKNIQKITRAMEMVAAARLRRAEQRISALRPYAGAIRRMTRQAAQAAGNLPRLPILSEHPQVQTVGILIVSGDRGLAGAFNSQVIRAGVRAAAEHEAEGREVRFYASGRRGNSSLTFRGREPVESYVGFTDRPAYGNAREIASDLIAAYVDGQVDRMEIIYNAFVSALTQNVTRETLLPLQQATITEDQNGEGSGEQNDDGRGSGEQNDDGRGSGEPRSDQQAGRDSLKTAEGGEPHPLVEYEPEPEQILERLVPAYVEISIFRALLESTASEHGARMTAMRNASENAGDLIKDLTLQMNRERQAEITQEILEVVSGAEALT